MPRDESQEIGMEPGVARHFWMKGGAQQVVLANRHDGSIVERCQHLDALLDALHRGTPDEDGVEWRVAKSRNLQVGLEAVALTTKGVALDTHAHGCQQRLPCERVVGF